MSSKVLLTPALLCHKAREASFIVMIRKIHAIKIYAIKKCLFQGALGVLSCVSILIKSSSALNIELQQSQPVRIVFCLHTGLAACYFFPAGRDCCWRWLMVAGGTGGCERERRRRRALMSMSMSAPVTRMLLGSWLLLMNFPAIGQDNCSCRGFPS